MHAQQYHAERITTSEGLPTNRVRALELANNGVLWIGTENGIASYHHNSVATHLINDSIPFYNTWSIEEDSQGGMWFAGYGEGVAYWNNGHWKLFTTQNGLPSNNARRLFSLHNSMYVGLDVGVVRIDLATLEVQPVSFEKPLNSMVHILDFATYEKRLFAFSIKSGVYEVKHQNLIQVSNEEGIYAAFLSNDSIWLAGEFTLQSGKVADWLEGKNLTTQKLSSKLWRFAQHQEQIYAAAWGMEYSKGGLFSVNHNALINDTYDFDFNDSRDLVVDSVHQLMYVSSMTQGVFKVPLNPFISAYSSGGVKQVISTENTLWLQNSTSLRVYKDHHIHVEINRNALLKFYNQSNKEIVQNWKNNSKGFARSTHFDANQIVLYHIRKSFSGIWLNTSIGMFEFNISGAFIQYLPTHNYVFNVSQNNTVIEAIPYGGVRFLTATSETFFDLKEEVPHNVLDIAVYDNQVFFASILGGLYRYANNEFTSLLSAHRFAVKKLRKLYRPSADELWIVSDYGTLYKANVLDTFELTDSIAIKPLYGEVVNDVVKYKSYTLLLTNQGVNIVDSNKTVRLINESDGLIGLLNSLTVINDTLIVAAENGYYQVDLAQYLSTKESWHGVRVIHFEVNNVERSAPRDHLLELAHNQNALQFELKPTGFMHNSKLKYSYRLKSNEQWNELGAEQHLVLPYLKWGTYQLQVKVADAHSGVVEVFDLTRFHISKPYYQEWWFYFLLLLGFSSIIYLVIDQRSKRILAENKRIAAVQFELEKAQMQGLLSRMNPHFLFNALNSIQSFVINNNGPKAVKYIGKFAKLMRNTLQLSQGLMISLEDEITYLKGYIEIENLRFGNVVDVQWYIDELLEIDEIKIPSMILQPVIENAFVHGFTPQIKSPCLQITLNAKQSHIEIIIADNGVGFDATQVSEESQGIKMMKKRLALLSKDKPHSVQYTSAPGIGTRVIIALQF